MAPVGAQVMMTLRALLMNRLLNVVA
jgi:hypothetical protein